MRHPAAFIVAGLLLMVGALAIGAVSTVGIAARPASLYLRHPEIVLHSVEAQPGLLVVLQVLASAGFAVTLFVFAVGCRPMLRVFGVLVGAGAGILGLALPALNAVRGFGVRRIEFVTPFGLAAVWGAALMLLLIFGIAVCCGRLPREAS